VPPRSQLEFLTDVASRVAPGGILIYKDIADRPFRYALANRMHDLLVAREWINYVPIETVIRKSESAGLEPERPTYRLTWWYLHELTVARKPPLT
jgi:hypothetical protein